MSQWLEHWMSVQGGSGFESHKGHVIFSYALFLFVTALSGIRLCFAKNWLRVIIIDDFLEMGVCYEYLHKADHDILFGEVSSSSGCLGWATLFYCGTP